MNEPEQVKGMDIEALSANIGIDAETYLMILDQFHERSLEDIDLIEAAIQEGKSDGAARGAHSIKGAAANLGIQDISDLAKSIEWKAKNDTADEIPALLTRLREKLRIVREMLP